MSTSLPVGTPPVSHLPCKAFPEHVAYRRETRDVAAESPRHLCHLVATTNLRNVAPDWVAALERRDARLHCVQGTGQAFYSRLTR